MVAGPGGVSLHSQLGSHPRLHEVNGPGARMARLRVLHASSSTMMHPVAGSRRPWHVHCTASDLPAVTPMSTLLPIATPMPKSSSDFPPADPRRMVWTLARLPLAQPLRTFAVALGKLASEAGVTYTAIIGAKLLVSQQLRVQDAFLTVGLTVGGNLLQLLEVGWEIQLERHFQDAMVPWLAQREVRNVPHDAATFDSLGRLTLERSTEWVQAAGLVGRLGSSIYAALNNAHQLPGAMLGVMLGIAMVRHGLGAWWTRHIQQRVTDWTLERGRSTFALLRGAGMGHAAEVAAEEARLSRNRASRQHLKRASIGVESVQEALLLGAGYGMYWRLGWFKPQSPLETLVAAQAAMVAAQALVAAILMIPLFVVGQTNMHARVETYLRAQPE